MSTGTKKDKLPSQNKEEKKPEPPAWLLEEYEAMKRLAAESSARGQDDTYWHSSLKRVETALRDEYGMEV